MLPLDDYIKNQLDQHLEQIGVCLDADIISMIGPIFPNREIAIRDVIEGLHPRQKCLGIILDTNGGVVEVVERIVYTIRHFYPEELVFLVPNRAMSAGTVLVMSGDRIFMNYFSCLGPIDPQIIRGGSLVPAQSYVEKFKELVEKSKSGQLTAAEYALLTKLDLGELGQFEQAAKLSTELIEKWLVKYKFKNWQFTETKREPVSHQKKEQTANRIAIALSDYAKWHSHGRAIDMKTLMTDDIALKIDEFSSIPGLEEEVQKYFGLLVDYLRRHQMETFIHSREYF
jgi:hypothetical protein